MFQLVLQTPQIRLVLLLNYWRSLSLEHWPALLVFTFNFVLLDCYWIRLLVDFFFIKILRLTFFSSPLMIFIIIEIFIVEHFIFLTQNLASFSTIFAKIVRNLHFICIILLLNILLCAKLAKSMWILNRDYSIRWLFILISQWRLVVAVIHIVEIVGSVVGVVVLVVRWVVSRVVWVGLVRVWMVSWVSFVVRWVLWIVRLLLPIRTLVTLLILIIWIVSSIIFL